MNRRGFLLTAPALLVLPELIVPKRTFFLPPMGGWADLTGQGLYQKLRDPALYEIWGVGQATFDSTYRTSVDFAHRAGESTTLTYQSRSDAPIKVNGFVLAPFEEVVFEYRQNGWVRI
jgi:hypothetical protein